MTFCIIIIIIINDKYVPIIVIKVDNHMFLGRENNSGKLQVISGKFQNSRKFQNNSINDVKQISLNHVIN